MAIVLKEVALFDFLDILFDLEQKTFTQSYHLRSPNKKVFYSYIRNSSVYIAYDNKKAIGFGSFEQRRDYAEITTLTVLTKYRRKKVGSLIMKKILSELNSIPVEVKTHPDNPAVIFYQKFGFVKDGIIDNYENLGQPRLILRRK